MATLVSVPTIQLFNATLLLAIQQSVQQDPADACYQFHLNAKTLATFQGLSFERIQALVANLDQCLFEPRVELLALLNAPPGLAGVLAGVREPNKALSGAATRPLSARQA